MTPEHLNMSYLPNRVKEYILSKNKHLKKPLEKFLNLNSYNKTHFKKLLSQITFVPDQMEEFIDLCFREI